jgi:hypothetical protein
MKLEDSASMKVEREGEPNARCQYATNLACGSSCRENNMDGECCGSGREGTCRNQRSSRSALVPVRKGSGACRESKKEQD